MARTHNYDAINYSGVDIRFCCNPYVTVSWDDSTDSLLCQPRDEEEIDYSFLRLLHNGTTFPARPPSRLAGKLKIYLGFPECSQLHYKI